MVEGIEIIARKRSEDPTQEALREHKAIWNEKVKVLISQLIAFKRGLNGRGDPRAGIPPSTIKNPFPPEIPQYLEEMAARYLDIINESKAIISEQENYSQKRRKGKKELGQTEPVTPAQPIVAFSKDQLEKFASWWGSRLWTWMSQYPIIGGAEFTKNKIALLNASTSLIDYLDEVDKSLIDSTPKAVYKFLSMKDFFEVRFMRLFSRLIEKAEESTVGTEPQVKIPENTTPASIPEKIEEPATIVDDLKNNILIDIHNLSRILIIGRKLEKISHTNLTKLADEYKSIHKTGLQIIRDLSSNDESKVINSSTLYASIKNRYNELLSAVRGYLEVEGTNFKEVLANIETKYKEAAARLGLEKLAQKSLGRLWRRTRLGLFSSEEDRMKLEVVVKIHKLIKIIDKLQDILEDKETETSLIVQYISEMVVELAVIADLMVSLAEFYNSQEELKKIKKEKYITNKIDRTSITKLKSIQRYYSEIGAKGDKQ